MSKTQRKQQRQQGTPQHAPPVTHLTLGPGPTVECGGKTWRLGFNTQDAKGRLEELFRSHVLREALKGKRALGGADGQEVYDTANDKVDGGHYLTFGDGWRRLLGTPAGSTLYLLSLLQHHHPDATADDARKLMVEEWEQTKAAMTAISPSFLAAVAVQMGASPDDAPGVATAIASRLASGEPDTATAS